MNGFYFAVEWIARNDEPTDTNLESIKGYISTGLVADLFNKLPLRVAEDIKLIREGKMTLRMANVKKNRRQ